MDHNVDRDEDGAQDMSETILSLAEIKRSIEGKLPIPPLKEVMASLHKNLISLPRNPKPKRSVFEKFEDVICEDIFSAAACGDLKSLKNFISKFCSDRVSDLKHDNKYSILHCAARWGQYEICSYLVLDLKVDVNIKDIEDSTPLHYAVLEGNTKIHKFPQKYTSPIFIGGLEDVSRSVTAGNQMKTMDVLVDLGADVNAFNLTEHSALHFAARLENIDAIANLLRHGCVAMCMPTSDFGTPLRFAAARETEHALDFLLKHKADPNVVPKGCLSPLLVAVMYNREGSAINLIRNGANTNYTAHRLAPLEVVISHGSMEIFKSLLEHGADTNRKDIYGLTPLELAALKNNRGMVEKLFHRTLPVEGIEDWSVDGVMDHCRSKKFEMEINQKANDVFQYYVSEGDNAFEARKYNRAITWYWLACIRNKDRAFFLAKRSLCYSMMKHLNSAFTDAIESTKLKPNNPLGSYARGVVFNSRKQFYLAAKYFEEACQLEKENKMYEDALRDALRNLLRSRMETYQ